MRAKLAIAVFGVLSASIGCMVAVAASCYAATIEFTTAKAKNITTLTFAGEQESIIVSFDLNNQAIEGQGVARAELKAIKIVSGKDAVHYKVTAECGGSALPVVMTAGEGEIKACTFKAIDNCPGMIKSEAEAEYEMPLGTKVPPKKLVLTK